MYQGLSADDGGWRQWSWDQQIASPSTDQQLMSASSLLFLLFLILLFWTFLDALVNKDKDKGEGEGKDKSTHLAHLSGPMFGLFFVNCSLRRHLCDIERAAVTKGCIYKWINKYTQIQYKEKLDQVYCAWLS